MKINLKKKLAPYTIDNDKYLKAQSKLLKSIVHPEDDNCELGNNAEPIPNYPDDDPMDLATDKFLDEFQKGGH